MIIERDTQPFLVSTLDTILTALTKIDANRARTIVCVDEHGVLRGMLTDGDFRRGLLRNPRLDLASPVCEVMNTSFVAAPVTAAPAVLERLLSDTITVLPLLDPKQHVVAIARHRGTDVRLGARLIGPGHPTLIVAEIGINHNGSFARGQELVDAAAACGADCAKFQMRDMDALYRSNAEAASGAEDLGSEYTLDLVSRFSLTNDEMFRLFDQAVDLGMIPLCTPWDPPSARALADYGVLGYKIASADLTNHQLIAEVAQTGRAILMSTGMSTEVEIVEAVTLLRSAGAPFVLLHCNSTYPAPMKDVHLDYLNRLRQVGGCPVGYSGHERGFHVALAAVAMGANVIEKHFTLDKELEGNDHKVSLLPDEFLQMTRAIRDVESALGGGSERQLTQGELMNRKNLAKSLVATHTLNPGDTVRRESVAVRSPGRGVQPNRLQDLIGRRMTRRIEAGDFFYEGDLGGPSSTEARSFRFRRPWGLPVRFHDYRKLLQLSNPDFLEFHLSYKDMDLFSLDLFPDELDLGLVVHSPDLFRGDHLLDLAAKDEAYRKRSVAELQRVVDLTAALTDRFTRARAPYVVVSVGGFSQNEPMSADARRRAYDTVVQSLEELATGPVEILPQTVPPFPWYLGGQLHCNLFVHADEIAEFCRSTRRRVCLDVSHSKLAANAQMRSFSEFLDLVAPHAAHLHIVDAAGVDSEGLQIGEGEIDFLELAQKLDDLTPAASFIPEIWQGHANDGEGFWIALDRLEQWF